MRKMMYMECFRAVYTNAFCQKTYILAAFARLAIEGDMKD